MPFSRRAFAITLALLSVLPGRGVLAQSDAPVIAVASSMQFAVTEIAEAFSNDTGQTVRLSFGSSGNFARQIREGAPFEVFIAADEDIIVDLHKDGFSPDEGRVYAIGRLVLAVPHGSPLAPDGSLAALKAALAEGRITRFAIANPEHAPYGMRAREALVHQGLWEDVQPYLVLGENITQAAQFALSGNAEGGITAYSLVLSAELKDLGTWELIPQEWHAPLRQRIVTLNDAGETAQAFYAYMDSETAHDIMKRYGFDLPQE
jgi:molybdate transport system substrate-binding protein